MMSIAFGYGRRNVNEGWRMYIMMQLKIYSRQKYHKDEQIEEDETADLAGKGNIRNM
jgi:hypothetical protein